MNRVILLAAVAILSSRVSARADDDALRPFIVSAAPYSFESGMVSGFESIGGSEQAIVALPMSLTVIYSDRFDLRFEGSVGLNHSDRYQAHSAVFGPGFNYWLDNQTVVAPFVRGGFAHVATTNQTFAVYGADVLVQRTTSLTPDLPYYNQTYATWGAKLGAVAYAEVGSGANTYIEYGFASLNAGMDWALVKGSADDSVRYRGKISAGSEFFIGSDRSLDRLYSVALSVRSVDGDTAKLRHQVEVSFASDANSYHRVLLGYTRGF
jgi:hypothetical protein